MEQFEGAVRSSRVALTPVSRWRVVSRAWATTRRILGPQNLELAFGSTLLCEF